MKLLLGTSNSGKAREINEYFEDLDINIVTLDDISKKIPPPEEPHQTIEENAFLKARHYSEKTNLRTISDDGGLFIDALNGWPGVKSAKVAESAEKKIEVVLNMLNEKNNNDRSARFKSAVFFHDPEKNISFSSVGTTKGEIINNPEKIETDQLGYDPIFKVNETERTYAELSEQEKNEISHRGKALEDIKTFLNNYYKTC
ncbi:MAG: RdgB/HAM1 family non-canonical purine NTP pyrophosphatase [Candidatus Magasanikbacteria bacterium]